MLVSLPPPHPSPPTQPAELRNSSLSSAQLMVPGPLLVLTCLGRALLQPAAPVKSPTHILVIVNPLIKLLGRRKQWEWPWLCAGWAPSEMGREVLAHHWPWVTGSPSCVPGRTAGNHRPWLRACGRSLSRGCMTVVVQLLPDGRPRPPAALGRVYLGLLAHRTLPGCVGATEGDASASWGSAPCSGSHSHFIQLLPAVGRHVYGQLGPRDSSPRQQFLTKPTNGLWSGLLSWVNRTFILQQQMPFVWLRGSPCLDMRWCLQPQCHPGVFHSPADIPHLLIHSCWTQCVRNSVSEKFCICLFH